jgi:hypothetical protein
MMLMLMLMMTNNGWRNTWAAVLWIPPRDIKEENTSGAERICT